MMCETYSRFSIYTQQLAYSGMLMTVFTSYTHHEICIAMYMYIPTIDISHDYKINRNGQLDNYVFSITFSFTSCYFTSTFSLP